MIDYSEHPKKIAEYWIKMTTLGDDCPDDIFEIGFSLNSLAYDDPTKAWQAIQYIIEAIDPDSLSRDGDHNLRKLAANLGAGPLETLLAQHGEALISEIEDDLPLKCHPAAIRASAISVTPWGAG